MTIEDTSLDHVGFVVKDINKAREIITDLFKFQTQTDVISVESQQINCQYVKYEGANFDLQLIEPTSKSSPVYESLSRGGGLHHLCFAVNDLEKSIDVAHEYGFRTVTPAFRGDGVGQRRAAFVYHPTAGLIELVEGTR